MSGSLRELRTQRELIQKHLHWLDAQIKDAEAASGKSNEPGLAEQVGHVSAQVEDHTRLAVEKLSHSNTEKNTYTEIDEALMEYSGGADIKRTKIGCLIFFAAITLLFLFLLFGLPYLL